MPGDIQVGTDTDNRKVIFKNCWAQHLLADTSTLHKSGFKPAELASHPEWLLSTMKKNWEKIKATFTIFEQQRHFHHVLGYDDSSDVDTYKNRASHFFRNSPLRRLTPQALTRLEASRGNVPSLQMIVLDIQLIEIISEQDPHKILYKYRIYLQNHTTSMTVDIPVHEMHSVIAKDAVSSDYASKLKFYWDDTNTEITPDELTNAANQQQNYLSKLAEGLKMLFDKKLKIKSQHDELQAKLNIASRTLKPLEDELTQLYEQTPSLKPVEYTSFQLPAIMTNMVRIRLFDDRKSSASKALPHSKAHLAKNKFYLELINIFQNQDLVAPAQIDNEEALLESYNANSQLLNQEILNTIAEMFQIDISEYRSAFAAIENRHKHLLKWLTYSTEDMTTKVRDDLKACKEVYAEVEKHNDLIHSKLSDIVKYQDRNALQKLQTHLENKNLTEQLQFLKDIKNQLNGLDQYTPNSLTASIEDIQGNPEKFLDALTNDIENFNKDLSTILPQLLNISSLSQPFIEARKKVHPEIVEQLEERNLAQKQEYETRLLAAESNIDRITDVIYQKQDQLDARYNQLKKPDTPYKNVTNLLEPLVDDLLDANFIDDKVQHAFDNISYANTNPYNSISTQYKLIQQEYFNHEAAPRRHKIPLIGKRLQHKYETKLSQKRAVMALSFADRLSQYQIDSEAELSYCNQFERDLTTFINSECLIEAPQQKKLNLFNKFSTQHKIQRQLCTLSEDVTNNLNIKLHEVQTIKVQLLSNEIQELNQQLNEERKTFEAEKEKYEGLLKAVEAQQQDIEKLREDYHQLSALANLSEQVLANSEELSNISDFPNQTAEQIKQIQTNLKAHKELKKRLHILLAKHRDTVIMPTALKQSLHSQKISFMPLPNVQQQGSAPDHKKENTTRVVSFI